MAAAEDVAVRLDEALSRPGFPVDPEVAPLVVLANQVRAMSRVQPSTSFVDALDRQLRRQAEAQLRARPAPARAPLFAGLQQWVLRGAGVAAVTAALMLAGWGTVQAAHGSLPGHPLYGLKRAAEALQLAFERDPEAQAALHLQMMSTRFDEAIGLAEAGEPLPPGLLAEASGSLGAALGVLEGLPAGPSEEVKDRLRTVFAEQMAHLQSILDSLPSDRAQGLQRAIEHAERRLLNLEDDIPGLGQPKDADGLSSGVPLGLDADLEFLQALRVAQMSRQFDIESSDALDLYFGECEQDWKCVRRVLREQAREERGTGRPETAGAQGQGQGKPEDPGSQGQGGQEDHGPPFDDGPPGKTGDGPPGPPEPPGPP